MMRREARQPVRYRLGIDLGSSSIGWAVLRLDKDNNPDYLIRIGTRIFHNGRAENGTSLAASRRSARQQRRRRDRTLRRKRRLLEALRRHGLMPEPGQASERLKSLNPYELRRKALDQKLEPHEIGRALFHLNQRRGFRSNRRTDRGDVKEIGKVRGAIEKLRSDLHESGARTVGEHLAKRLEEGRGTRARLATTTAKVEDVFYVDRKMLEDEFSAIWEAQQRHHPALLTEAARTDIRGIVFFQRPLRPVQPGVCSFYTGEKRAPLAYPDTQAFRIWQEINNLRVREPGTSMQRALTADERSKLAHELMRVEKLTFARIKTLLGLHRTVVLNLESSKRKQLNGDAVSAGFARDDAIGSRWWTLSPVTKRQVVDLLLDHRLTDDEAITRLSSQFGLAAEQARAVISVSLPDGYASYSTRAIGELLPHLEAGHSLSHAIEVAKLPKPKRLDALDALPYYGEVLTSYVAGGNFDPSERNVEKRFGRIANPSVHIALNQLRKLVNALIAQYGKPTQVVVELTRDLKLGWERAREIEREQSKNQRFNKQLDEELRKYKLPENYENRLRLRLFKEMQGNDGLAVQCVYSGRTISQAMLFTPQIEIDHILPYRRTLDDSIANKVLCYAEANRFKGDRSPSEAFASSPRDYVWEDIIQRAERLTRNRIRRFSANAMTEFEESGGFLARQLSDTAYMSKVARMYLETITPETWTTTGKLTGMLRAKWGLNSLLSHDDKKNRRDHRHHALDATVIACIDRKIVKSIADAAGRAEDEKRDKLLSQLAQPWPTFLPALENGLRRVVVSHRADHEPQGALHNDTSYGCRDLSKQSAGTALRIVRVYKPLPSLADKSSEELESKVVDLRIRRELTELLSNSAKKTDAQAAFESYSAQRGIRRVRLEEPITTIALRDRRSGAPYRFVKGDSNYCCEIFTDKRGKWTCEIISRFEANQPAFREFRASKVYKTQSFRGHPLVMRILVNDMLRLNISNREDVYRVQKISGKNIVLAHHVVSGAPDKNPVNIPGVTSSITCSPEKLRGLQARLVFVDMLGRVFDRGWTDAQQNRGDSGK